MLTLVVTIAIALILAVFATQNTGLTSLNFGKFVLSDIPIYLAVLVPLLVGVVVAFFLHIARDLSQRLTINEDKDRIRNLKQQLAEITKSAHKLELENIKLKSGKGLKKDENSI